VEVKTRLGVGPVKPGRPGGSTHDPGDPGKSRRNLLDVVSRIGDKRLVLWLSRRVKRVVATGQSWKEKVKRPCDGSCLIITIDLIE
jgi:hypothetical protein